MKINKKNRNILISLIVIILIILALFIGINKSKNAKIDADNKHKSAVKTGEVSKNAVKTTKDNSKAPSVKSSQNGTSDANANTTTEEKAQIAKKQKAQVAQAAQAAKAAKAAQAKSETAKVVNSKDGLIVFVKAATFGSTSELVLDNNKLSSSYKHYQFFLGNKAISKVESITNSKTTLFPVQEVGTEVAIKFLGQDKKVIKELKIKLSGR